MEFMEYEVSYFRHEHLTASWSIRATTAMIWSRLSLGLMCYQFRLFGLYDCIVNPRLFARMRQEALGFLFDEATDLMQYVAWYLQDPFKERSSFCVLSSLKTGKRQVK